MHTLPSATQQRQQRRTALTRSSSERRRALALSLRNVTGALHTHAHHQETHGSVVSGNGHSTCVPRRRSTHRVRAHGLKMRVPRRVGVACPREPRRASRTLARCPFPTGKALAVELQAFAIAMAVPGAIAVAVADAAAANGGYAQQQHYSHRPNHGEPTTPSVVPSWCSKRGVRAT